MAAGSRPERKRQQGGVPKPPVQQREVRRAGPGRGGAGNQGRPQLRRDSGSSDLPPPLLPPTSPCWGPAPPHCRTPYAGTLEPAELRQRWRKHHPLLSLQSLLKGALQRHPQRGSSAGRPAWGLEAELFLSWGTGLKAAALDRLSPPYNPAGAALRGRASVCMWRDNMTIWPVCVEPRGDTSNFRAGNIN